MTISSSSSAMEGRSASVALISLTWSTLSPRWSRPWWYPRATRSPSLPNLSCWAAPWTSLGRTYSSNSLLPPKMVLVLLITVGPRSWIDREGLRLPAMLRNKWMTLLKNFVTSINQRLKHWTTAYKSIRLKKKNFKTKKKALRSCSQRMLFSSQATRLTRSDDAGTKSLRSTKKYSKKRRDKLCSRHSWEPTTWSSRNWVKTGAPRRISSSCLSSIGLKKPPYRKKLTQVSPFSCRKICTRLTLTLIDIVVISFVRNDVIS